MTPRSQPFWSATMTPRKLAALLLLGPVVAVVLLLEVFGIDPDLLAVIIIGCAAPPATGFVLLYAFTVRWWTFWIGRALFISTTGMTALIDLSLLFNWLGNDYPGRDIVRNTVFFYVALGAALKFASILIDKLPLWRGKRARHSAGSRADTM